MEPWIGGTTGTWRPVVKDLLVQQPDYRYDYRYSIGITLNYRTRHCLHGRIRGQPCTVQVKMVGSHATVPRYFSFFAFHTLNNSLCFTSSVSFTILGFSRSLSSSSVCDFHDRAVVAVFWPHSID